MSDEEVQTEATKNTEDATEQVPAKVSNEEAMKNRFKLIEGEEVLLTKSPSPMRRASTSDSTGIVQPCEAASGTASSTPPGLPSIGS